MTRHQPAKLWDLESGKVALLNERESMQYVTGFSKKSPANQTGKAGDRQAVPQEILDGLKDRIPEAARGVEQTSDGRRVIVYHDDFSMAFWDVATGEPICRCYLFHNSGRWLTVMPDGQCHGNLQYVRYRKKSTAQDK